MFIKITNGVPISYTIGELRRDNPNVSFPKDISMEMLASFDVYPVNQTTAPIIDSKTHRHTQSVQLINEEWTQVWQSVELSQSAAEQNIRAYRNNLLKDGDWIVTYHTEKGTSIPQEWLDYRQALRDVTLQEGFPFSVEWPLTPI